MFLSAVRAENIKIISCSVFSYEENAQSFLDLTPVFRLLKYLCFQYGRIFVVPHYRTVARLLCLCHLCCSLFLTGSLVNIIGKTVIQKAQPCCNVSIKVQSNALTLLTLK